MPKNVLVADDSHTIRKVIEMILANEDLQIFSVDNGMDAVTQAKVLAPDLIILDVTMPGKNGYEACDILKSDPQTQPIPVVLMSGTFETFDEALAAKVKSDGHLTKPFESQTLLDKVRSLTGQSSEPVASLPAQAPVPTLASTMRSSESPLSKPTLSVPPAPSMSPSASSSSPFRAGAGLTASSSPRPGAPSFPAAPRAPIPLSTPVPSAPPTSPRPGVVSSQVVRPPVGIRPPASMPVASRPGAPSYSRPLMGSATPTPNRGRDPFGLGGVASPAVRPFAPGEPSGVLGDAKTPVGIGMNAGAPSFAPAAPLRPTTDGGEAALREALSKASQEVIEKIAWEVVPQLAETIIREHVARYMKERESKS